MAQCVTEDGTMVTKVTTKGFMTYPAPTNGIGSAQYITLAGIGITQSGSKADFVVMLAPLHGGITQMSNIFSKSLPRIEATGIVRNLGFVLLNPEVRHTERQAALKSIQRMAAQGDTAAATILAQFAESKQDLNEHVSAPPKRYGAQRTAYEASKARRSQQKK